MAHVITRDSLSIDGLITIKNYDGLYRVRNLMIHAVYMQVSRYDRPSHGYKLITEEEITEIISDNVYAYEISRAIDALLTI